MSGTASLVGATGITTLAGDDAIPLFAGAAELLAELEAAGFLLGVATGKIAAGLDRALAQHGIAHRFVATRCADEGFPKPHPDMLLHLMERVGASRDETLMIGDTTHDLELARNAGAARGGRLRRARGRRVCALRAACYRAFGSRAWGVVADERLISPKCTRKSGRRQR